MAAVAESRSEEKTIWPWVIAAVAGVGAVLVARWAPVWRESADFAHGWIVPVFAIYLAWERRNDRPILVGVAKSYWPWVAAGIVGGAMLLIGRFLLEPFPTWPAALWFFSAGGWILIGSLLAIAGGVATARHFAFPILFTATALPWPTLLELNFILPMRGALASIAAEVIHVLGYPAVAQGTVIEVGRGQVGVDEACSGVRSLQAAIMVGLLLGEVFRLKASRRWWLLGVALGLALATNLARTCFLAWQGAMRGPTGVAEWHDVAGTLQMSVALGGMVLAAWLWRKDSAPASITGTSAHGQKSFEHHGGRALAVLVLSVALVVEGSAQLWFHSGGFTQTVSRWDARLPETLRSYRETNFTPSMQSILQCDRHQLGQWESPQGQRRAGYVLNWERGHAARQVVSLHNPEICLPYSGQRFIAQRGTIDLPLQDGTALTFRVSEFDGPTGVFFVYYVAWDLDRGTALTPAADDSLGAWWKYRLDTVAERRRQVAARVVAVALYEPHGLAESKEAFVSEAPQLFMGLTGVKN
ncbi:exosortase/archaeosortase family protein [Oleiharenicola lentus]|uniref:exosortase/archaeosortase family protein n=1 Tax=Oleiharenicola lentus TaxID=2508720 RepID=UPI003F66D927